MAMNSADVLNASNVGAYWADVINSADYVYNEDITGLDPKQLLYREAARKMFPNKQAFIEGAQQAFGKRYNETLSNLSHEQYPPDPNDALNKAGQGQMTPLDVLKGGLQHWLSRRAATAPQVNLPEMVGLEREVNAIRRKEVVDGLMRGTEDAYSNIEMYRAKRKLYNYRPQPFMEGIQDGNLAAAPDGGFGGGEVANSYQGMVGTAGMPSNQPNKFTAYRDYNIITGRGRVGAYPNAYNAILPETTLSSDLDNAAVLNAPF